MARMEEICRQGFGGETWEKETLGKLGLDGFSKIAVRVK
jgi:hypothetical protein